MSLTSCVVSNSPCGSHESSCAKVLNREDSLSTAFTVMASTGHTTAQCPHWSDLSPVTTAFSSCMERVLEGQTFTHKPHPTHFSLSITVVTVLSILLSCMLR